MKKILLSFALAFCAFAVSAHETFTVQHQPEGVECKTYTYIIKGPDTLKLDFFRAIGDTQKRPTIILSFGGGWAGGERSLYASGLAARYVKHGINACAIDYRLSMKDVAQVDSTWFGYYYTRAITRAVEDTYDATMFLIKNSDMLGVDVSKIMLNGGSAGATNSVMAEYMLCNDEPLAISRLPKDFNYAAVIPCAGAVWKIGMTEPKWNKRPCPHLFMHGTKDWVVPFWNQLIPASNFVGAGPSVLKDIFKKNGWPYEAFFVEEADHMMAAAPTFSDGMRMRDQMEHVLDFIDRVVIDKQQLQIEYNEKDYNEPLNFLAQLAKLKKMAEKDKAEEKNAQPKESDLKKAEPKKEPDVYSIAPYGSGKYVTNNVNGGGVKMTIRYDESMKETRPVYVINGADDANTETLVERGFVVVKVNTNEKGLRKVAAYMSKNAGRWNGNGSQVVIAGKDAIAAATNAKCAGVVAFGGNQKTAISIAKPILYIGSTEDKAAWADAEKAKRTFMVYTAKDGKPADTSRCRIIAAFLDRCIANGEVIAVRINEEAL